MDLPANSSGINISDVRGRAALRVSGVLGKPKSSAPLIYVKVHFGVEVIETDCTRMDMGRREGPYIKIVEQPASKALRFRYECEGRSAGSIPGVSSTPENKTYPTIQICNYRGRAVVVVSCVTKEQPHRPHPHNLVGRDGCKKGVCTVEVHNETMTQSFDHLGIQCVKKKDIEEALKAREEIRVDPFRTGFSHRSQPGSIDLNAVRLCFQAFLEDEPGKFKLALMPVVSEVIYDKKALCDLAICKLSHCSASVAGGQEVILLCEKVAKEDISVRLFEEKSGQVVWEGLGDFTPTQVHKQVAISFKTPRYKTLQVEAAVKVSIQLRRPSDGETSEALPFLLTPLDSGVSGDQLSRKKAKTSHAHVDTALLPDKDMRAANPRMSPGVVKMEPDASPNYYWGSPNVHRTPSPMDYTNPVSPNHQLYVTTNTAYPPSSVGMMSALSPAGAVGQTSPHSHPSLGYNLPGPSTMFNTAAQPNNGAYQVNILDISSSIPSIPPISHGQIANISLNSRDFEFVDVIDGNLSSLNNLSLNCDSQPRAAPSASQENMTDSFSKYVEEVAKKIL